MGMYIVLLLMPMLLQHIAIKEGPANHNKKNQRALAFFFILLTVMLVLRHETVGTDTQNYLKILNDISKTGWTGLFRKDIEIGFVFFCKVISSVFPNPQFFIAITAILGMVMIYPTYKRLCLDASLTVMLFCLMSTFFMMFSGIKQMLAIGLGFIAYGFTRKKMILPFLFVVVLAITFHTSAFMLFFMYPLYHARITKNWLVAVIPALGLLFVFNEPVFSFLGIFIERYTDYDAEITATGAYAMIFLFALFAIFAFVIPDEKKLDRETIGLRNFLLMALALQMFAPLHTLAMRMNYYYIIFIPLLMPKIIEARSHRWKNVAIWGKNVMTAFFFVYFFMTLDGGLATLNVYPYHFFWEYVA